jgi:hypothetical protein
LFSIWGRYSDSGGSLLEKAPGVCYLWRFRLVIYAVAMAQLQKHGSLSCFFHMRSRGVENFVRAISTESGANTVQTARKTFS